MSLSRIATGPIGYKRDGDKQDHVGQNGRTRLARPNSQARTGTVKKIFSLFSLSVDIAYTEQRENHGYMILMGLVTPFIQFCRVVSSGMVEPSRSQYFMRRVPWVVLTSHCVSPDIMLIIQNALYIIFSQGS